MTMQDKREQSYYSGTHAHVTDDESVANLQHRNSQHPSIFIERKIPFMIVEIDAGKTGYLS